MADSIPSPYNFVPLSDKVFFPDWSHQVSMDTPFSDGISGTLEIKVTAKTPIYIRNGGDHPEDRDRLNSESYLDFFRVTRDGKYAIPGTSLKGMLRAVVEIVSFGKIAGTKEKTSRVVDHRYAVRDLQNKTLYTNHITETIKGGFKPKVKAAWLSENDSGEWSVTLCDMARVEQEKLEEYFVCTLGEKGPASQKYSKIKPRTEISFECEKEENHKHSKDTFLRYRKVTELGSGSKSGEIVMTGQPSKRDGSEGRKHMEFIFFNEDGGSIEVEDSVKKDFEFAHSMLGENRKDNAEWRYWRPRLREGRIPVFVLMNGNKVSSMGLAMMYRLPYKNSVLETVAHTSTDHLDGSRVDLAELVFGRVENTEGLKGRVSVETLLADGQPQPMSTVQTVLSGPKPTYYPNYIEQKLQKNGKVQSYKTFMDETSRIRGWKRYITRPDSDRSPMVEQPPTINVATGFRPLPTGTTFSGKIHVHNLRPKELGALVWAITWGGQADLRHSLGMGKPYGFGSVTVQITDSRGLVWCNPKRTETLNVDICQSEFIQLMEKFKNGWARCEQINALMSMAFPQTKWPQDLRYPSLENGNEFVSHKKNSHALVTPPPYVQVARATTPRSENNPQSTRQRTKVKTRFVMPVEVERLLKDIESLSASKAVKKVKGSGLDPKTLDPRAREAVYVKLKNKSGITNWNLKEVLETWKTK